MRPPLLLQEARNLTEQAVAGEVTAAVVDVLELVEIEQDQAQRTRRGVVQLALQAGLERARLDKPVSQSCDACQTRRSFSACRASSNACRCSTNRRVCQIRSRISVMAVTILTPVSVILIAREPSPRTVENRLACTVNWVLSSDSRDDNNCRRLLSWTGPFFSSDRMTSPKTLSSSSMGSVAAHSRIASLRKLTCLK